jgi:hypothetical protein
MPRVHATRYLAAVPRPAGRSAAWLLLICVPFSVKPAAAVVWGVGVVGGSGGCARTPSLISVLVPGWLRSGDMMVDGVP